MISLVVMAAGMGSRFGGLKQIEPVDNQGNIIMDFSVYDAYRAGFDRIIFVIKREMEETFKEKIIARLPRDIDVKYVFQDISDIPIGYTVPNGRVKPWGTGHAVLIEDYYRAIEEGRPFRIPGTEGAKVIQLILSMYHSHGNRIKTMA